MRNDNANRRISTASGQPDYVERAQATGAAPLPPPPSSQQAAPWIGVELPIDPVLALAGAYWNDQRFLVRDVVVKPGHVEVVTGEDGRRYRRTHAPETRQRHVAPPGMSIEDARERGLDFFIPSAGWIRGGVKREQEYPENLGAVEGAGAFTDEPIDDDGKEG
jgi:hypothetical protein